MASLTPKKIDLSKINNGQKYEVGDGISPDAINAPIEASAYAMEQAEAFTQNPDISDISGEGTPSVTMVDTILNGRTYKKFKLSNFGSFASRPNLLLNSFFNVNQRGIWNDSSNNTYMADRWHKYNPYTKVEITNNKCYITLLSDLNNYQTIIGQTIECPTNLFGKTITASVYIEDIKTTNEMAINTGIIFLDENKSYMTGAYLQTPVVGKRVASISVPMNTKFIRFIIEPVNNAKAGDTFVFSRAKIEEGEFPTPLSPIPYDQELIMCQRYYQVIYGLNRAFGSTQFYDTRHQYYIPMRVSPTLTVFALHLPNEINKILDLENNELVPVENFFAYQNNFGFTPICDTYSLVKDNNYGYTIICDAEIY